MVCAQAQARGQSAAETQLSPQAAYDRATRELEIVRRSPRNWPEVELAARKGAREQAKAACLAGGLAGDFAATDFPLLVAADHSGIIRVMQVATDDALAPGGEVEQMVRHVVGAWPPE